MSTDTTAKNIVAMIQTRLDGLGGSERRVADLVLNDPGKFTGIGLAELAGLAGVSQPTVIRFCRKLGFGGYADFKVAFAQGMAVAPAVMHQEIAPDDSVQDIVRKVADSAILAISSARDGIDPKKIEAAAKLMIEARRIECFGNGAAQVVAVEAQNKIYRLGIPCAATTDMFTQTILAATLGPKDVILYVSFSGEARLHIETLTLAKTAGAKIIAVTRPGSRIARAADIAIAVKVKEDFEAFTPISTPVTFMIAVDAIAMSVAQMLPSTVIRRHAAGKAALAKHTQPERRVKASPDRQK